MSNAALQSKIDDLISGLPTDLFIAGEWRAAQGNKRFSVENPATASELTTVADASIEDGDAALSAAVTAQETWGDTAPRDRGELLRAAFEKVLERTEDFALLMTLEMGKSLSEARGEVTYGAEFLRWFSEEAVRIHGRYSVAPAGTSRLLTLQRPVGPSLLITPWNFPLAMATRKIAPAIAAGCTTVVKPASLTPLTTLLFAQILQEVGVPKGVVNVITTSKSGDVTDPLLRDERLRKLSFTGSTEVGRHLLKSAADRVLRTSMELGGNAPFLVFQDADIDAAVEGALIAKLRNIGEACTAANRFLVHKSVHAEFTRKLTDRMAEKSTGPGTDEDADLGPLISESERDKVHDLVRAAQEAGAKLKTGGGVPNKTGWFYEPTVLADVTANSPIFHQEIFGPVAPIIAFSDEAEGIRLANDTEMGLVAYAYTRDSARTLRLAEKLDVGMVGINTGIVSNPAAPFGGVKQSGIGREGGFEGIEEYLETKYVGLPDPNAGN